MNNWNNVKCICTEQKLINYTPYLYLHYLYYLFFTLSIAIYSLYYLYFLLCLLIFIYLFICVVPFFFLTQCVSLFVDKRVVLSLLLQNLTFPWPKSQDDNPARDCITHEIKVQAYNNNNDNNNNKGTVDIK